ncbi:hypothetical protein [Streptomyces sp. NPDC053048]|uniref:hypothetical protein n=1 Tax=Streptomyces sp. NPDC053048 TaxID=3365694 RepID=UPI0037D8321F
MPSYAKDPRHIKLTAVLVPLLRRTCPEGGGGFGGSYELRLSAEEVDELGGLDLIRSAMRKAARELGWTKVQTYGSSGGPVTVAGVTDEREIPEPYASVVHQSNMDRQREAMAAVSRALQDGKTRAAPNSVYLKTQEFRAALAEAGEGRLRP